MLKRKDNFFQQAALLPQWTEAIGIIILTTPNCIWEHLSKLPLSNKQYIRKNYVFSKDDPTLCYHHTLSDLQTFIPQLLTQYLHPYQLRNVHVQVYSPSPPIYCREHTSQFQEKSRVQKPHPPPISPPPPSTITWATQFKWMVRCPIMCTRSTMPFSFSSFLSKSLIIDAQNKREWLKQQIKKHSSSTF